MTRPFLISLTTTLFFFITPAQARFNYELSAPDQWLATTQTKSSEGLGAILRELGVEPNWQNLSWVDSIKQVNPGKIDASNKIKTNNETLIIPISGLKDCQGYSKLISSLQAKVQPPIPPIPPEPSAPIAPPQPPVPTAQPERTQPLPPPPAPDVSYAAKNRFALWLGAGLSQLAGEDNSGNETKLKSDAIFAAGLAWETLWSEQWKTKIYIQALRQTFQDVSNITFTQDEDFVYQAGIEANYALSPGTLLGLFIEYKGLHRADFAFTSLNVKRLDTFAAGIPLLFDLMHLSSRKVSLELRPYYIFSASDQGLDLEGGFGIQSRLQLSTRNTVGLHYWLEHTYEAQEVKNSLNNTSDLNLHRTLLYVGYKF